MVIEITKCVDGKRNVNPLDITCDPLSKTCDPIDPPCKDLDDI